MENSTERHPITAVARLTVKELREQIQQLEAEGRVARALLRESLRREARARQADDVPTAGTA
jgi:hypothetical protein